MQEPHFWSPPNPLAPQLSPTQQKSGVQSHEQSARRSAKPKAERPEAETSQDPPSLTEPEEPKFSPSAETPFPGSPIQLPLNLSTGDPLKVAAPIPVTRRRGSRDDGGVGAVDSESCGPSPSPDRSRKTSLASHPNFTNVGAQKSGSSGSDSNF